MRKEDFPRAQRLGTHIPPPVPLLAKTCLEGSLVQKTVVSFHTPELTGLAGWPLGDEGET